MRTSDRYRWWALVVLLLGFFSTGISITLLTAVLPTIAREFHVGESTIAWVVTGPMLVYGIFMPTFGKAADLYGRKRVYLWGWGISMALAGVAALSWSAGSLIAFRFLGAIAGAATGPTTMAIILSAFPPSERVKAMGWWSFAGAGAPVIGLVVGGPLVDLVGWRWLFGVQPPLAVPGLVLAVLVLRPDEPVERPRFDIAGSVLLGLAMGSLLFALNRWGAEVGWARTDVLVPLALAPLFAGMFVLVERRAAEPLLRLDYFGRRNVAVPILIQGIAVIPYMGTFFLTPFLLQDVLGYDNTRTALALLPRPLSNSIMSALAGYITVRIGERVSAVGGTAVMAAGLVVLAGVGQHSSFGHVVLALVLTGMGLGVSMPGLASSVANSVEERDFGSISAAQEMVFMVGNVLGMQGLQTIWATRARVVGEVAAYNDTFIIGAVIAIAATVLALFVRSMHRSQPFPPIESPEAPLVPEPVGD
ncbi:MAG TPA: MFS transporter [Actinomycetota bacterium]|nr:MFS transporter [Actinomycetota bacterium]